MATRIKNFFKHSFKARKDPELYVIMEKHGLEAYGFFFITIEIISEIAWDQKKNDKIRIAFKNFCRETGLTPSKVKRFLEIFNQNQLILHQMSSDFIEITIPNLPKYLGSIGSNDRIEEREEEETTGEYIKRRGEDTNHHSGVSIPSKQSDLTEDQQSVYFDFESKNWRKNDNYSATNDLKKYFPKLDINEEVKGITDHLIKNAYKHKNSDQPKGFLYLVNCLKRSKMNKLEETCLRD